MFQGVGKRDWVAGGAYFWGFGPYAQVTVFQGTYGLLETGQSGSLLSETLY